MYSVEGDGNKKTRIPLVIVVKGKRRQGKPGGIFKKISIECTHARMSYHTDKEK